MTMVLTVIYFCLATALYSGHQSEARSICEPNPCGDNSICTVRYATVLACSCQPGYQQTNQGCYKDAYTFLRDLDPADYFQDETENEAVSVKVKKQVDEGEAREVDEEANQHQARFPGPLNQRPRLLLPGQLSRGNRPIAFNTNGDDGDVETGNTAQGGSPTASIDIDLVRIRDEKVHEEEEEKVVREDDDPFRPVFRKNPFARTRIQGRVISDDNLDDIFDEECLVNEDCAYTEFCKDNFCVDACRGSPVCATGALCKAALNRPVCYCPPGFQGNPYRECKEIPSRVGMRFKRRV